VTWWQAAIKRAVDLLLGIVAVVGLLPVALLISAAVLADSSGHVLYAARRVGRGGRTFTMWKFRSMARGADRQGPTVTGSHDYRITRVGGFLRRTKLDEIPQLINVLVGDMSLVGPRPEAPSLVERWDDEERQVLTMRPGITGPTQLAYIGEEVLLVGNPDEVYERELMHAKLAVDLEYVRNYRLQRDLAILWKTLWAVLLPQERQRNRPRRRYTLKERLASVRPGALLLDALLAALAAALAVGLRIDRNNIFAAIGAYWVFVPLAAFVRPVTLALSGAYLRVWRYPTIADVGLIVGSLGAGTVIMTLAIFFVMQPSGFPGSVGFPRTALAIEFVLSFLALGGVRLASRVRQEDVGIATDGYAAGPPRPVLIFGAGDAGAQLVREMQRNRALRLDPVAFLDEDRGKAGRRIYGVEVLGGSDLLMTVATEREVSEVIIAIPGVGGEELRRIVTICESAGIPARTLPATTELLNESVTVNKIRPVRVEDLLRRDSATIPDEQQRELVSGRAILVTGAGGSIGSEVCRQVASLGARKLVMFEHAETPLFYIDEQIRRLNPDVEAVARLGDATDDAAVERVFASERPDVVLHAAAHKHLPLSESNVASTTWTNVRGTRVVAETAARHGTGVFIFISTDKAVDPTSIMGATKRIGELIVQGVGADATGRFVIVRFGNVLGSQGSVVEVFRQQIEAGGPVTITHPAISRYFMTIPEAVRLILLSGAVGRDGDIHVLNMGRPVRIVDLAHDMIRLAAQGGDKDIRIEYTGLRPGEKLEEVLFSDAEERVDTDYEFLLVARRRAASTSESVRDIVPELERLAQCGDEQALRRILRSAA
jgi:FlaA1/EpsC-like NDP-sugar epimerase/lipopolysaccharide/colanic/teichoic acid biosynthesis glycosyltransferase